MNALAQATVRDALATEFVRCWASEYHSRRLSAGWPPNSSTSTIMIVTLIESFTCGRMCSRPITALIGSDGKPFTTRGKPFTTFGRHCVTVDTLADSNTISPMTTMRYMTHMTTRRTSTTTRTSRTGHAKSIVINVSLAIVNMSDDSRRLAITLAQPSLSLAYLPPPLGRTQHGLPRVYHPPKGKEGIVYARPSYITHLKYSVSRVTRR